MLNFCDFIQDYVFTTNHHLKRPSTAYAYFNTCTFLRISVRISDCEYSLPSKRAHDVKMTSY